MEKFATNIFWIWPFSDPAEPEKDHFDLLQSNKPQNFSPHNFLIFQWKPINFSGISSQFSGKVAIWPFRGQRSYLILDIFNLSKILCFNIWFLLYSIGVIVLGLKLFNQQKFSGSGYFLIRQRPDQNIAKKHSFFNWNTILWCFNNLKTL